MITARGRLPKDYIYNKLELTTIIKRLNIKIRERCKFALSTTRMFYLRTQQGNVF